MKFHRWEGTFGPRLDFASLRPDSARREIIIDIERPEGFDGPLALEGRGCDYLRPRVGTEHDTRCAQFTCRVDFMNATRPIIELSTQPRLPKMDRLIGQSTTHGFRRALLGVFDDPTESSSDGFNLLSRMLDDVGMATLVSGNVLTAASWRPHLLRVQSGFQTDVCAGMVPDGWLAEETHRWSRESEPVPFRPLEMHQVDGAATELGRPLIPHAMRRERRIEIGPTDGAEGFTIQSWMRDSRCDSALTIFIVHEYEVLAHVTEELLVERLEVVPRVLPGQECPAAVATAHTLVGMSLCDLEQHVRSTLRGVHSCTHLNDVLRTIPDASSLLPTGITKGLTGGR
jgi:DUF2889 family protein